MFELQGGSLGFIVSLIADVFIAPYILLHPQTSIKTDVMPKSFTILRL